MSLAGIGLVGGVGTFFYGPILCFCVLLFLLGLHRSPALDGLTRKVQAFWYVTVLLVAGAGLYEMGHFIEIHKEHPLTAKEIWEGHSAGPAPSTPVINNTYQTTVAEDREVHGEVEVYFGYPSSSRGTAVVANTMTQRKAVFDKAVEGGTFNTKLLPGYPKQQFQEIPIVVRNSGNGAIQNMSVNIAANTFIEPLTPDGKFGEGNSIVYDIPELPPYTMGAQERILIVKIRSEASAFNPDALIVTVRGKGIKSPHSEVMKYAFMPLPS
jgi:hypothetical protein